MPVKHNSLSATRALPTLCDGLVRFLLYQIFLGYFTNRKQGQLLENGYSEPKYKDHD